MEAMEIRATYTGKNLSLGFETGKEYVLRVYNNPFSKVTTIKTKEGLKCWYSSALAFMFNWDNIVKL
jgi:hypothetical protein